MRREVREVQMQSHLALVQRMKREEINLKALPENDADQRNAKLTAIAQTEVALNQLEQNAPIGRVVVHIQPEVKALAEHCRRYRLARWRRAGYPQESELRAGFGTGLQPYCDQLPAGTQREVVSQPGGRAEPDGGQESSLCGPG